MGGLEGWDGADTDTNAWRGLLRGLPALGLAVPCSATGTAIHIRRPKLHTQPCLVRSGAGRAALQSPGGTLQSWLGFLPQGMSSASQHHHLGAFSGPPRDPLREEPMLTQVRRGRDGEWILHTDWGGGCQAVKVRMDE